MTAVVKGDNIGETLYCVIVYTSQENITRVVYAPIYIIFFAETKWDNEEYSFF